MGQQHQKLYTTMKGNHRLVLSIVGVLLALLLTVGFFERIPIDGTTLAIDWKGLWPALKGGTVEYSNTTGILIPPWSFLIVLPLGWLSFRSSWGVLNYITMIVLMLSVPRTKSRLTMLISVLVIALSFPTLRTIVDGNFEMLVIAGCLLIGYGISKQNVMALILGVLLASSKIQESWFLLLLLPILLRKQVIKNKVLAVQAGLAFVCTPLLIWKGQEWLSAVFAIKQRSSIMDCSLWATSARLQLPLIITALLGFCIFAITVVVIYKVQAPFSREQMGLMIAASLILSPYTAGNNFLTLYAIGGIPLLQSSVAIGLGIIGLANLPIFFLGHRDILYWWGATYWTVAFLIVWVILILCITYPHHQIAIQPPHVADIATSPP